MFDVFGNFDSVEELNACAKGLLEEQDLEHLKVLAEENGIPDGIREVYEHHMSEELVDSCTITKAVVDGQGEPVLTYGEKTPVKRVTGSKKAPKKSSGEIA